MVILTFLGKQKIALLLIHLDSTTTLKRVEITTNLLVQDSCYTIMPTLVTVILWRILDYIYFFERVYALNTPKLTLNLFNLPCKREEDACVSYLMLGQIPVCTWLTPGKP